MEPSLASADPEREEKLRLARKKLTKFQARRSGNQTPLSSAGGDTPPAPRQKPPPSQPASLPELDHAHQAPSSNATDAPVRPSRLWQETSAPAASPSASVISSLMQSVTGRSRQPSPTRAVPPRPASPNRGASIPPRPGSPIQQHPSIAQSAPETNDVPLPPRPASPHRASNGAFGFASGLKSILRASGDQLGSFLEGTTKVVKDRAEAFRESFGGDKGISRESLDETMIVGRERDDEVLDQQPQESLDPFTFSSHIPPPPTFHIPYTSTSPPNAHPGQNNAGGLDFFNSIGQNKPSSPRGRSPSPIPFTFNDPSPAAPFSMSPTNTQLPPRPSSPPRSPSGIKAVFPSTFNPAQDSPLPPRPASPASPKRLSPSRASVGDEIPFSFDAPVAGDQTFPVALYTLDSSPFEIYDTPQTFPPQFNRNPPTRPSVSPIRTGGGHSLVPVPPTPASPDGHGFRSSRIPRPVPSDALSPVAEHNSVSAGNLGSEETGSKRSRSRSRGRRRRSSRERSAENSSPLSRQREEFPAAGLTSPRSPTFEAQQDLSHSERERALHDKEISLRNREARSRERELAVVEEMTRGRQDLLAMQVDLDEGRRAAEAELRELEEERAFLHTQRKTLREWEESLHERERALSSAEERLRSTQLAAEDSRHRVEREARRLEDLLRDVEEERQRVAEERSAYLSGVATEDRLNTRLLELEQERLSLAKEKAELREAVRDCQEDRALVEAEKAALREAESRIKEREEEVLRQASAAKEDGQRASDFWDEAVRKEAEITALKEQLEHDRVEFEKSIATFKERRAAAERDDEERAAHIQSQWKRVEAELAGVSQERESLRQEQSKLEQERSLLADREASLRKMAEEYEKKRHHLSNAEELSPKREADSNRKIAELEAENAALRDELKHSSGPSHSFNEQRISELEASNRLLQNNVLKLTEMLDSERTRQPLSSMSHVGTSNEPSSIAVSQKLHDLEQQLHAVTDEERRLRNALIAIASSHADLEKFRNEATIILSEFKQSKSGATTPSLITSIPPGAISPGGVQRLRDAAIDEINQTDAEGRSASNKNVYDLLNAIVSLTSTNQALTKKLEETSAKMGDITSPLSPSSSRKAGLTGSGAAATESFLPIKIPSTVSTPKATSPRVQNQSIPAAQALPIFAMDAGVTPTLRSQKASDQPPTRQPLVVNTKWDSASRPETRYAPPSQWGLSSPRRLSGSSRGGYTTDGGSIQYESRRATRSSWAARGTAADSSSSRFLSDVDESNLDSSSEFAQSATFGRMPNIRPPEAPVAATSAYFGPSASSYKREVQQRNTVSALHRLHTTSGISAASPDINTAGLPSSADLLPAAQQQQQQQQQRKNSSPTKAPGKFLASSAVTTAYVHPVPSRSSLKGGGGSSSSAQRHGPAGGVNGHRRPPQRGGPAGGSLDDGETSASAFDTETDEKKAGKAHESGGGGSSSSAFEKAFPRAVSIEGLKAYFTDEDLTNFSETTRKILFGDAMRTGSSSSSSSSMTPAAASSHVRAPPAVTVSPQRGSAAGVVAPLSAGSENEGARARQSGANGRQDIRSLIRNRVKERDLGGF